MGPDHGSKDMIHRIHARNWANQLDVPVLCSEDRIMYQPEFCAVWLDRLTSKSNGHGLLFSVQFRVWAGVCSDAPAFSAAACKRLSLVHKAIR